MAFLEFKLTADRKLLKLLGRLVRAVEGIERHLRKTVNPTGPVHFRQVPGDNRMSQIFVTLPQLPDHPESGDVVKGELTPTVNGEVGSVIETAVGQEEAFLGDFAEDVALSVSFVFVDNAGNKSVNPLVAEYTVSDTTPPPDAVEGLGFRQE